MTIAEKFHSNDNYIIFRFFLSSICDDRGTNVSVFLRTHRYRLQLEVHGEMFNFQISLKFREFFSVFQDLLLKYLSKYFRP